MCQAAKKVSKNAREFADYIMLLAYSGARMAEALRLTWSDVNWKQKQLTIGADGLNKNADRGWWIFRAELGVLAMNSRRVPITE